MDHPPALGILAGKLEGAAGGAGTIHWQLQSQRVRWEVLLHAECPDGTALWALLEHLPPPTGKAAPTACLPLNAAVEQA